MHPKRGKGRPRLPADRVRKFSLHATVTLDERRAVRKAAQDAEQTVSAWVRERILEALGRS